MANKSHPSAEQVAAQLQAEGKVPTAADIMAQVNDLEQGNVDSAITADLEQFSPPEDSIEVDDSVDESTNTIDTLPFDKTEEEEDVIQITDEAATQQDEVVEEVQQQLSDTDQRMYESAYKKGWRPQEEFVGNPDDWVNFDEFERRQPLFDELNKQRKAYKNLEKKMESVLDVMAKQQQKAQEAEIAYAKQLRNEAIELGDVDTVNQYDTYIAERQEALRAEQSQFNVQQQQDQVVQPLPPESIEFIERNSHWWNSDSAKANSMRQYAANRETEIRRLNPQLPLKSVYTMLEKDIQTVFSPQKALKKPLQAVSTERATKSAGMPKKSYTASDMSPEQKQIFNMLSKDHKQIYFKSLVDTGELGNKKTKSK